MSAQDRLREIRQELNAEFNLPKRKNAKGKQPCRSVRKINALYKERKQLRATL